jgi:hypothetical protein
LSFCKLEDDTIYDLTLNTVSIKNDNIGPKGVIVFSTNASSIADIFDDSDVDKQIFDSKIILKESAISAKVKCSLWNPKQENVFVICILQEQLNIIVAYIKLEEYSLNYKEKKIKIFSEEYLDAQISKSNFPFLYADKQELDFNDGKSVYELKFKIGLFNEGDSLIITGKTHSINYINLIDDCNIKENKLICKLNKTSFEGNLFTNEDTFSVMSFGEGYGMINYDFVYDIVIKNNINKENINVQIKKLLNGVVNNQGIIAYETDVTKISEVGTKFFDLNFVKKDSTDAKTARCYFKKYQDNKPLGLLCLAEFGSSGDYSLSEIKQEIKLENINLKYNFIIKPVKNEEIINCNSKDRDGGLIYSIFPDILDYTKKDSYKVIFGGGVSYLKGLAIEPNLKDLDCYYDKIYINCTVPKSYFEGQKNGYYYAYQKNHEGGKSPCYETAPIKVILTDDSKSSAEKVNIFRYIFALAITFIML